MSGYLLFFSHKPQSRWLALIASISASRFGFRTCMLAEGEADADDARAAGSFDTIIDLSRPIGSADALNTGEIEEKLGNIERAAGQHFVNEAIAMDRRYNMTGRTYEDIIRDLGRVAAHIENLVAERGKPAALIVEPNLASKRLACLMLRDTPAFYIYQLTKFGLRIYFDYSLGYDWAAVGGAYARLKSAGIPQDVLRQAEALYERNKDKYTVPHDTQLLMSRGGNTGQIIRQATGTVTNLGKSMFRGVSPALLGSKAVRFMRRYARLKRSSSYLRRTSVSIEPSTLNYAVFFLHVQPEHTVEGVAFEYRNQIDTAVSIAAALPCGMRLLVKEHPGMLGERSIAEYRRLSEAKNIMVVSEGADHQSLLRNAKIIFTLSGTVSIEGLILGIPVITLGRIYYNFFDGIFHLENGLAKLPELVRVVLDSRETVKINSRSNALYALSAILIASYSGKFSSMFPREEMEAKENLQDLESALVTEFERMNLLQAGTHGALPGSAPAHGARLLDDLGRSFPGQALVHPVGSTGA